jgi:hypothetical protein
MNMNMKRIISLMRLALALATAQMFGLGVAAMSAATVWVERESYSRTEDSPWYPGVLSGSVYLENFITGPIGTQGFGTPYISSPRGFKGHESGYTSVDGDDEIIDDFGRFGGSYLLGATTAPDGSRVSFRFNFVANESGELPHSVGLVITLAHRNTVSPLYNVSTVKAFDTSGALLSEWEITDLPTSIIDTTPENRPYYSNGARFVGIRSDVGIATFTISGVAVIDHVQYSFVSIPEPSAMAMGVAVGVGLCYRRRRSMAF